MHDPPPSRQRRAPSYAPSILSGRRLASFSRIALARANSPRIAPPASTLWDSLPASARGYMVAICAPHSLRATRTPRAPLRPPGIACRLAARPRGTLARPPPNYGLAPRVANERLAATATGPPPSLPRPATHQRLAPSVARAPPILPPAPSLSRAPPSLAASVATRRPFAPSGRDPPPSASISRKIRLLAESVGYARKLASNPNLAKTGVEPTPRENRVCTYIG
jgi:hypothetical protein